MAAQLYAPALIAAAAGAAMQMKGAQDAQDAMEAKAQAELLRQRGYKKKAAQTFEQSLSGAGADTAHQQMAEGEAARLRATEQVQAMPVASARSPIAESTSNRQVSDIQNRQANQAAATYMAPSEWQLRQWIRNLRAQQELALIGGQAFGSQAILPFELQAASHAGDSLSGGGQMLGTFGSLLGAGLGG